MSQTPTPEAAEGAATPAVAAPWPWPAGAATGVGSLPGVDIREAVRTVAGELPDLPHLPELPGRGPGADVVGRTAALLVDLHVDYQPSGWRFVDRAGLDERRARSWLGEDLDALEEVLRDFTGTVKVQVAGPWSLAAAIERHRGDKALGDPGARRDIAESLAEGVVAHLADVRRRLPAASLLLQVDEPTLPSVLAGHVRTASGFDVLRAIEAHDAETVLRDLIGAARAPVIAHCCAPDPPLPLLVAAGAAAVSIDARLLKLEQSGRFDEPLGEALEAGVGLWAGLVPSTGDDGRPPDAGELVGPVRRLWGRLGLAPDLLGKSVVVTPTCGMAAASPPHARAAMAACRAAGGLLIEDPEGR